MLSTIRNRLLLMAGLVALSVFFLWPRDITRRSRGADGRMRDTVETRIPLKQGLDLRGGIHLALEVDQSKGTVADPAGALDRALTVIRSRVDEFGVAEPVVQKQGDNRIVVELAGISEPARAKDIVQRSAFLEFRIVDMANQFRSAIPAIDAELRRLGVRARGTGPTGDRAVERLLGGDSAGRNAPGIGKDTSNTAGALSALLFNGQVPGEYLVPEEDYPRVDSIIHIPGIQHLIPRGLQLLWAASPVSQGARSYRALYALQARPIITGDYLVDAKATVDPVYSRPVVNFTLSRQGGRIFGRETARHIKDYMAIVLDGRAQGQPPIINSQISQRGQIEMGSGNLQTAQDLALILRAGSLPAPLVIVEERTVGPSLGQDAIDKSIVAGIIAIVMVFLIYGIYYRKSGLLALGALVFYVIFTLGGLAAFGSTLTVPGLAGFVLSVGMAIDGNVLIYERIREELVAGRTIRAAVDAGFKEAWRAIIDTHATTFITALFLYQFGTGPVQGFAVTLSVGIVASLLTAVFVSRTLFLIWLARRPDMKELSI